MTARVLPEVAPARPFYFELARTTLDIDTMTLADIYELFPRLFDAHHLSYDSSKLMACGYTCGREGVEIEVSIFKADHDEGHQVEIRRMNGCRHQFAAIADELSEALDIPFRGGKAVGIPMSPTLPADFGAPPGSHFE